MSLVLRNETAYNKALRPINRLCTLTSMITPPRQREVARALAPVVEAAMVPVEQRDATAALPTTTVSTRLRIVVPRPFMDHGVGLQPLRQSLCLRLKNLKLP